MLKDLCVVVQLTTAQAEFGLPSPGTCKDMEDKVHTQRQVDFTLHTESCRTSTDQRGEVSYGRLILILVCDCGCLARTCRVCSTS